MRPIDADARIELMKHIHCEECDINKRSEIFGAQCSPCWVLNAIEELENAPSLDVQPAQIGRWLSFSGTHYTGREDEQGDPEYKEHIFFVCSNCRRKTVVRENFCPRCGWMMTGGADNGGN